MDQNSPEVQRLMAQQELLSKVTRLDLKRYPLVLSCFYFVLKILDEKSDYSLLGQMYERWCGQLLVLASRVLPSQLCRPLCRLACTRNQQVQSENGRRPLN